MLKNFDFRYKLSIGEKFKSVLKTIATIGLSTSLMLGATFGISACGKKTLSAEIDPPKQETPIEPDEPTKPDQPGNPDQPENPDEPTEPDPDQPIDPDAPSKPDQPENPEQPDQPEEPFSLNAVTFNKIIENITPTLMVMAQTLSGKNVSVDKFYDFYLTKNTETGFVDTIGATYSETSEQKGRSFIWGTITLPVTEDLTLESLSKSAPEYRIKDSIVRSKYGFNASPEKEAQFAETIYMLHSQTFKNYQTAEWLGWRYTHGLGWDSHVVTCYESGKIREVVYTICNNDTFLSIADAVKQNFYGKEASNSTYTIHEEQTYDLPEGYINIRNTLKSFEEENEK